MDASFGLYGGGAQAPSHLPPYLLGANIRGSPGASYGRQNSLVNTSTSSEQLLQRSFTRTGTGNAGTVTSDDSNPRFDKFPMKGPPVRNLHDDTHTYTSTPVQPYSPERRQLSFSVTQSVKKSPYVMDTVSAHDSIAPELSYNSSMRSLSSVDMGHPFVERTYSHSHSDDGGSEDDSELYWVTVFGFPSSASSYILTQFSQCGTILKYKVMSTGNWMHILYQSKLDAKKALGKNGKVFGNGIMVGVQRCVDKDVLQSHNDSILDYPAESRSSYIRPLTAAYHASASQNQVMPPTSNTPQKKDGLLSKAVEYIFGW